ncbi:MAG: phytoene/squalene synthase family protein [Candidatus Chlorobium antarcticum]|nr:phytoene/squalene synthase family protein [Candidatus Chlorobium antarcticum]
MTNGNNGTISIPQYSKELAPRDAYQHCRQIAKHHAKTFYLATLFLPKRLQNPIFAIYALLRTVDDLVDNAEEKLTKGTITRETINTLLEDWKTRLKACYAGETGSDPIMVAWNHTLESYPIAIEHPLELIEGVAMDIEFTPFETFDELYVYCYKVASVVGLMTSEIFGYSDPAALRHAIDLGIAMQLTNILRDIGEDVDRGRIYIPLEDLERFGYSHEEFMQKTMNEKFRRLMQFQIERARNYYLSSDKGIPMLQKESRLAVALSSVNYSNILKSIEENNYDVFSQRAYRSLSQKLLTIPEVWLKSNATS